MKVEFAPYHEMIIYICSHLPNLETLKIFTQRGAEVDDIERLVELKHLKALRLGMYYFDEESHVRLMSIIGELTTLEKLELSFSIRQELEHRQWTALGKSLTSLREIYLGKYNLKADTLLTFLETVPQLTDFKFAGCALVLNEALRGDIVQLRRKQASLRSAEVLPLRIFADTASREIEHYEGILTVQRLEKDPREYEDFHY